MIGSIAHARGRLSPHDQDAHLSLLRGNRTDEVSDISWNYIPTSFNGDNDSAGRHAINIEPRNSVYSLISRTSLIGLSVKLGHCPCLELELVSLKQSIGTSKITRTAAQLVGNGPSVNTLQPVPDYINRDEGDINPDPISSETFGGVNGSPHPQNGSSPIPPGPEDAEIIRSSNAIGFWVG